MLAVPFAAHAQDSTPARTGGVSLPTGDYITPTVLSGAVQQDLNPRLPQYPNFVAGEAVLSQLSPDGTTLAVICAGQNSLDNTSTGATDAANSTQYIFLYNVAGANKTHPQFLQAIKQTNAHVGLVFSPAGNVIYAAGGNDDAVYVYRDENGYIPVGKISLGHKGVGVGLSVQPNTSGLAMSDDGSTLVAVNNYNDSISVIDTASGTVRYEHDLRPYFANNEGTSGVAGGEYPFAVVLKGNLAYVSSERDRQVVVIDISSPTAGHLVTRIPVAGNPYGMTFNADKSKLYVAEENADQVAVIDPASNTVSDTIDVRAPVGTLTGTKLTGVSPIAVTIRPDGKYLYVVNNGANDLAVVPLQGPNANKVIGLIPTAYAPKDVTFSSDGSWMYIINSKSNQGPNPGNLAGATARITNLTYPGGNAAANTRSLESNQYQFQLEHASLVSAKTPTVQQLAQLTAQVAVNDGYSLGESQGDMQTMAFLHNKIKHIIYIVKENRTYDQILGDLNNGANGDPSLTQFGQAVTPNFHNFARQFVTLDNFMDPSDGSMDGWSWSMRGRVTNDEEITQQINYAFVNRGLSYEGEGSNRNVPVGLATTAARDAATTNQFSSLSATLPGGTANLLPGVSDVAATDTPRGQQTGYIFDAVMQAGLSVRNYGWMVNNIGPTTQNGQPITNAGAAGVVQAAEINPTLVPVTDVYFRGFDQTYADQWDVNEWYREFQQYEAYGDLPSLETVRLSHDHTGSFSTALGGVNTPDEEEADNDLAVGRMVDYVAHSKFAKSTLFIITEDDSQDGPDHVDSHRAPAYFVGAYVKKGGVVVDTQYGQVNALRTIEDILGTKHINLNTAYQPAMSQVFDTGSNGSWTYNAVASTVLQSTQLAMADFGVKYAEGPRIYPHHDAAYWAEKTKGFDFSHEDRVPPGLMNRVLWEGTMGDKPFPAVINPGRSKGAIDADGDGD